MNKPDKVVEEDDVDQALDTLYEEIAALDSRLNYQLTLSTAEFRSLFAMVRMMHDYIPMTTEERQLALNYLFELLCEVKLETQSAAGRLLH